jgi:hypothetical protein
METIVMHLSFSFVTDLLKQASLTCPTSAKNDTYLH